jgi:hypothetical protein
MVAEHRELRMNVIFQGPGVTRDTGTAHVVNDATNLGHLVHMRVMRSRCSMQDRVAKPDLLGDGGVPRDLPFSTELQNTSCPGRMPRKT